MSNGDILVTVCARAGSVGVPDKALREFLGKPLIAHTIRTGLEWPRTSRLVVSTDSPEIAEVARQAGADVPFTRPAELSGSDVGKLPVISHALRETERVHETSFAAVVDLDLTCPLRTVDDVERGWQAFTDADCDVCFSVAPARKSPYFNMVERSPGGRVGLSKEPATPLVGRQQAPRVWEMNASVYVYDAGFLRSGPKTVWDGSCEMFEMPGYSRFDIDSEEDLVINEALARRLGLG